MSDSPPGLPKAKLFSAHIRKTWAITPWLAKFRLANAAIVWIGPLQVTWRMPWLPGVARQLHPECFSGDKLNGGRK